MTALLLCLVAAPGATLEVAVEGRAAEVVAYHAGRPVARAPVADGRARFADLAARAYDLRAEGAGRMSDIERGVRATRGGEGLDARLIARVAARVRVKTAEGATVWVDGLAMPGHEFELAHGLHRMVVDHPERLSSAERLLRVAGDLDVTVELDGGLVALGTVRDGKGEPVPGARVLAFADGVASSRAATTDEAGRFGISGLRGDVVSLLVRAPGFAESLRRVPFFPGRERARVEFRLLPGASVSVKTGVAAAEAILLPEWYEDALEEPRLRANYVPFEARGEQATFGGLVAGRRYRILVTAPGRRPATTETFVAGEEAAPPLPPLAPAAAIAGHVVGEGAGRFVVCRGAAGDFEQRTDRAGRFRFDDLDPGRYLLFVRHLDEAGVEVEAGADDVALSPRPDETPRRVRGVVLDADDRPLPGVEVAGNGRRVVSGADGAFDLGALPRGRLHAELRLTPGPGCRALAKDPHLPRTEPKARPGGKLTLPLARAGVLRARFETGGARLARATLLIAGTSGIRIRRRLPRGATAAEIPDLPYGSYEIDVAAPGWLGSDRGVVPVDGVKREPATVRLVRGRSVAGRVVLRRTVARPGATPVDVDEEAGQARVTMLGGRATTPVEADGSFLLEGLPAAPVVLSAAAPGYPPVSETVDLRDGNATDFVFALRAGVVLSVQILGEKDEPLPDARVRFLDRHGIDVRDLAALGRFGGTVADDVDTARMRDHFTLLREPTGHVRAPFVGPGSYRVFVSAEGYKPLRVGVQARTRLEIEALRRTLRKVPEDLTPPIRLDRLAKKAEEEKRDD